MKAEKTQPPSTPAGATSGPNAGKSRQPDSRQSGSRQADPRQAEWSKFLGPVEDLETYVKGDWWRQIFNANYLRTDGDVV